MTDRRRLTTGLRQLGLLLGAFVLGLVLFVLVALWVPDVLRVVQEPTSGGTADAGAPTAAAGGDAEVALAWNDDGRHGPRADLGTAAPDSDGADPGGDPDGDPTADSTPPAADADAAADADEGAGADAAADADAGTDAGDATQVLDLVNAEREAVGCPALEADPALDDLAAAHAADMADRGYVGHTDPDGRTPWDRAADAGIEGLAAENIARGQGDAVAVVAAWMDSAGHRANLLECDHVRHGLGVSRADGGPWWTQVFAR